MDGNLLERGFDAQARSLREFGYPDVTVQMVRSAHGDWIKGAPGSDIIAKFCESAFEDHPEIFGVAQTIGDA